MARKATNPQNLKPIPKGVSLNPAGRPVGSKNLTTYLKELLNMEVDVMQKYSNGKPAGIVKMTYREKILKALATKASNGDVRAIIEIFDRVEGKAKQSVEVSGEMTQNVNIFNKLDHIMNKLDAGEDTNKIQPS